MGNIVSALNSLDDSLDQLRTRCYLHAGRADRVLSAIVNVSNIIVHIAPGAHSDRYDDVVETTNAVAHCDPANGATFDHTMASVESLINTLT